MSQHLSSRVIIEEEEPRVRGIPSIPSAVAGAVGITERGPIGKPVLVTSIDEFEQLFGGFTENSDLALAVMGFFQNGGNQLYVVRTTHYSQIENASTFTAKASEGDLVVRNIWIPASVLGSDEETFSLKNGDKIHLSFNDGGELSEFEFRATSANVINTVSGPYALSDGDTLKLAFEDEREQTIEFSAGDFADIAQATEAEVAAVINREISGGKSKVDGEISISSDVIGSNSRVRVIGGSANGQLGFPLDGRVGGGNVADISAVTMEEIKALVEFGGSRYEVDRDDDNRLRIKVLEYDPSLSLQVMPGTPEQLGFDNELHVGTQSGEATAFQLRTKSPGAYGNNIQVEVFASNPGSEEFSLVVSEDGVQREVFADLTVDVTSDRYCEKVVNNGTTGSKLVVFEDLHLSPPTKPAEQIVWLSGGNDGLTGIDDMDFVGSPNSKTGLFALDSVQDLTLLFVPGRATSLVHNAMVYYAEQVRKGQVFAVLDPPEKASATQIVNYVDSAHLRELSEHAAIYWPRVKVANPAKSVFGASDTVAVPPSGIICGVFARTDAARAGGVYDPPAGIETGRMFGVLGFETDEVLEESKRDLVFPKRINPLTTGPGLPRFIDGARTLKSNGNFPYVSERRGVSFIEQSIKQGLQFARHRNNTESLRARVQRTLTAFLMNQMNNGAFSSKDPSKAFFVDVSNTLNTPSVIAQGQLIARVGLATNKPAEFIIIKISAKQDALETELTA